MPTARTRNARWIVPIALLAAAIALVTLSLRPQSPLGGSRAALVDGALPLQDVARRATQPVRDLIRWAGDVRTAQAERDALAAENAALRDELARAQAAEQDVEELQGLLGYQRSAGFPSLGDLAPLPARVVARSPAISSSAVVIDVGADDGVQVGDPVLAGLTPTVDVGGAALIGRVEAVTGSTADVALLSDPAVAVGAAVAGRRGADGILQPSAADPSVLVLGFVRRSSVVQPGDRVVTSGFADASGAIGSAYPRGLPIGVVSESRQSDADAYKSVLVVPWVDLGAFANVIVLTRGGAG